MSNKCFIDSLPEELKVRIVELIAQADESYKVMIDALVRRTDLKEEFGDMFYERGKVHGKGTKLLSFVSKSWRKLCLPYCLKTVKLLETVGTLWDFSIAPEYFEFFTTLLVPGGPLTSGGKKCSSINDTVRAIGQLERLPGITSMSVEAGSFAKMFDTASLPPGLDDPDIAIVWKALKRKLSRLERLEINAVTNIVQVEELLPLSSNLKFLKLTSAWCRGPDDLATGGIVNGAKSIIGLKNLQHLHLETNRHSYAILDLDDLCDHLQSASSLPSLSSLSLTSEELHASWRPLACLFDKSLLSLDFKSVESSDNDFAFLIPPFLFTGSHFPLLESLSVSAPRSVSQPILLSCARSIFPRISSLSFGLNFHTNVNAPSILSSVESVYKHAREVVPIGGHVQIYDERWALDEATLEKARSFNIETTPITPWPSEALIESSEYHVGGDNIKWRKDIPEGVNKALDHLVNLRDRAVESGSQVEWLKVEKLIREAEFDRIAMQT